MKILPAIDIKDKKCVRLVKGDFQNKTIYNFSPLEQAKKFKDLGFNYLHIVDLDGALTGELVNLNLIEEIVKKLDVKIEIGGGIRSLEKINRYINIGADKIILGSIAVKNKNFLKEACNINKDKIVLGLDAKNGLIAISGWKEETKERAEDFLKTVNNYGFSRVIYTDIERDGTKTSPNLEETNKIADISTVPVYVSGGISSIQDLKNIKNNKTLNIEGVVVGKAIYDGDINLKELSDFCNA